MFTFALVKQNNGAIAQLVEQRTENPCVPGSIPGGTTNDSVIKKSLELLKFKGFLFYLFSYSLYRCLSTHIASISIQPVRCDVNPTLSSSAGAFLQRPLYNIVF